MTVDQFRKAALAFPEAAESGHHGHPDFRVAGKIFATLGYPDDAHGVVMIGPEDQRFFVREFAGMFEPVRGSWGKRGSTVVNLRAARIAPVRDALEIAWTRRAPRRLVTD
jgi:hypothetical protein